MRFEKKFSEYVDEIEKADSDSLKNVMEKCFLNSHEAALLLAAWAMCDLEEGVIVSVEYDEQPFEQPFRLFEKTQVSEGEVR